MNRALCVLLALLLSACAGGPVKRVFPPEVSIQELSRSGSGYHVKLRINNFSTIAMRFAKIEFAVQFDEQAWGQLSSSFDLSIGPNSSDVLEVSVPRESAAVDHAMKEGRALRYSLKGRINSSEPKEHFDVEFTSALNPVPGLDGVMR